MYQNKHGLFIMVAEVNFLNNNPDVVCVRTVNARCRSARCIACTTRTGAAAYLSSAHWKERASTNLYLASRTAMDTSRGMSAGAQCIIIFARNMGPTYAIGNYSVVP